MTTNQKQTQNRRDNTATQPDVLNHETLRRQMYERIAEGQAMTTVEEIAHNKMR